MKPAQTIAIIAGIIVVLVVIMALVAEQPLGSDVAVIPITGVITVGGQGDLFTGDGTSSTDTARFIEQANEANNIEIILLEINSPGGSAVASEEIARAVENSEKPVLAWIREAGASGGYWIASEADHIIANRMSITGSVGVVAGYLEFNEFLDEYNITYRRLTGGEHKDIGNPFTELTEEQQALLQEKIDRIHGFFLEEVQENRNLDKQQMDEIDSGIFLLGIEAYELGLVDELGGRQEVKAWLEQELGHEPNYVRYQKPKSFFEELLGTNTQLPGFSIRS